MRSKTLVTLLAVFAFVWFVVSTIRLNEGLVTVQFAFSQPARLELWMVMLAAFGLGAGVILLFDITGGARRYARARRARQQSRVSEEVEGLYLRGLDSLVDGRHEKALARFEEVLEKEPDHQNALIKKGDTLRALRRHREAAETLERVVRMAPESLLALYSLSDVYLDAGTDERARAILERIIELGPTTTVSAHRKLRDLLVKQLKWSEAHRIQQHLVGLVTSAEERAEERLIFNGIRLGLGEKQLADEQVKEAIDTFRSILEEDDQFVGAHIRLGEALALIEESEEAIRTWRHGYEKTGSTEPLTALQSFYLRDEQPEEAISVWKQAIVLSDNELPLRYCLGKLYYRLFMLDEALKELQMIEDRVSGLPALHVFIARILESKKELPAALAKMKMLMAEVEGLMMDYACSHCQWRVSEWTERCGRCGSWSTIRLHIPVTATPEPAILPAPTWSTP